MTTDTEKGIQVEDGNNNILSLRCPKCGQNKALVLDVHGLARITVDSCVLEDPRVDPKGWAICEACGYGQEGPEDISSFKDEVVFDTGLEVLPTSTTEQTDLQKLHGDWRALMMGYEDIRIFYCRSEEDQDAMGTAMDEVERVAHALAIKNELAGVERDEDDRASGYMKGYEFVVEKYHCKGICGEWHTRDEVILKANKDLLSALEFMAEYGEIDEDSLLLPVQGAVIHALDELQLLGVEGFEHPEGD